jgi:hypothetical protein
MFNGVKVSCLQLYFQNYVRSDVPRLTNTPALRRQLSLDSRMRLHYFILVSVISEGDVFNLNNLDFFLHSPTTSIGTCFPRYRDLITTLRHTTHSRTPLGEWSARRTDLYLTTYNNHKRERHPCPRRDSNPQSQQASNRRPTS